MDVLSTSNWSDEFSIHLSRRNKPVHFGGSLDFLYDGPCGLQKVVPDGPGT